MLKFWIRQKKETGLEVYRNSYLPCFDPALKKSTPLEELTFVCLDTETSGLNLKKDQILSIGAVKIFQFDIKVAESWECFIRRSYEAQSESVVIHGILPTISSEKIDEQSALSALLAYLGNAVVVGHHIQFDINMINRALKAWHTPALKNKVIDTADLFVRLQDKNPYSPVKTPSLDELCQQYQIPEHDRHTALGDALITALLFQKLLFRLQNKGVRTLADLMRK